MITSEGDSTNSGYAFDEEETAALNQLCDAVRERAGDSDFAEDDCVYLYSPDYEYDEEDPSIVTAGTMLVCNISIEGKYVVEHHSTNNEPGTFVFFEYDSFAEVQRKVRDVLGIADKPSS